MNVGIKPYPEYRDSGIPWLGNIPKHWVIQRIKYLLKEQDDRSLKGTEQLLRVSQYTGVTERKHFFENLNTISRTDSRANSLIGYKRVEPGDLVVNIMLAWNGSMGISQFIGIASPAYCVYRFRGDFQPWYFHYLLRSPIYKSRIKGLSTGVIESRLRLYSDDLYRMEALVPPLEEQVAIVRYLDHMDRLIKHYIRAKQKQIKLLNEQKQAVVTKAVTCGLELIVKLRQSGVDWLGDIPENWGIRRLRFLATIKTGGCDTVDRSDNGEYPFFVRSQIVERIDTYSFDGEAVLTAGDGAGVAKVFHYFNGKFDYHQRVYRFSNFKEVKGKFFFYYFRNFLKYEAFKETAKSTVDSLRLPMLQNFPVVLPSCKEQESIIRFIDQETTKIDNFVNTIKEEIIKMQEYHTRLTADVVTGKLDVREAAAYLPEELTALEPDEEELPEEEALEELETEPEEGEV